MESLSTFASWFWNFGVMFLLVLSIVVFIHEMGHFLVARWYGVTVKVFSIGFGPEIWGRYDRYGTRWRVAWIPLGGYVKFIDDENAASAGARSGAEASPGHFHSKPVPHRAAVVAAGPMANFLLSILIYTVLNMWVGIQTLPAYVDKVRPGMPAEAAGFMPGDKIVDIGGTPIEKFEDVLRIVAVNAGEPLVFTVERAGAKVQLTATPNAVEEKTYGRTLRRGVIGIERSVSPDKIETRHVGLFGAVGAAVKETYDTIAQSLSGIASVLTRRQSAEQLGGPLMMAEVTAKVAAAGFEPMLRWIAFISASIGFLNLLPIPVLDGGHLLFYAYEAVFRRPASERLQQFGFQLGFMLLMGLMILVNFNDLMSLWRRYVGGG